MGAFTKGSQNLATLLEHEDNCIQKVYDVHRPWGAEMSHGYRLLH